MAGGFRGAGQGWRGRGGWVDQVDSGVIGWVAGTVDMHELQVHYSDQVLELTPILNMHCGTHAGGDIEHADFLDWLNVGLLDALVLPLQNNIGAAEHLHTVLRTQRQ